MDDASHYLELERRVPELNMARYYTLELDRDLFGTILARRCWGRIGTRGQTKAVAYSSIDAAIAELARLERIKRRRGYLDRSGAG